MLILILTSILLIALFTKKGCFYGSNIDWVNQHSVIPDYFRSQFYKTGKLIPEFASQLGAGQNIFNLSYYGLLSPVILISYAFPMVSMTTYIAVSSIILVIASVLLIYLWLIDNKIDEVDALACGIFYLCASPILFQSHRQIMFVNYMPFLLIALIGVNRYFQKKKSGMLIIGTFLMIMTSYYFSVGGIICLCIYAIYKYLNIYPGFQIKRFIKEGFLFGIRITIAVFMSGIILLPTLMAIKNGRASSGTSTHHYPLKLLLTPEFNFSKLLYSSYSMGFTSIALAAIIAMIFFKRKEDRFLGICLLGIITCPIFVFMLNGCMYLKGKVLIPFIPLIVLCISKFATHFYELKLRFFLPVLFFIEYKAYFFLSDDYKKVFLKDCIFVFICFALYGKRRLKEWVYFPSLLCCFVICCNVNSYDDYVLETTLKNINNKDKLEVIEQVTNKDNSLYRFSDLTQTKKTSNKVYNDKFYKTSLYSSVYNTNYNILYQRIFNNPNPSRNAVNCTDSNNTLFSCLMGVKYVVTDAGAPVGYEFASKKGIYSVYENKNAFPIAYASSSLMSLSQFEKLDTLNQSIALLKNVIVDKSVPIQYSYYVFDENIELPLKKEYSSHYMVNLKSKNTLKVKLTKEQSEKILILDIIFDQAPKKGDIKILANGTLNVLSSRRAPYPNNNLDFRYVLSGYEGKDEINIELSPGDYTIKDVKLSSLDYSMLEDARRDITPMNIDRSTGKYVLSGSIDIKEDGYFTCTIPYADGFTAYVDGRKQKIENVNTTFIGFPIKKGYHTIKIDYHAPMLKEGKIISLVGICGLLILMFIEQKRRINLEVCDNKNNETQSVEEEKHDKL